jgi:hypothetical protein
MILAKKRAPSTPNPSDEWDPTNQHLWDQVLDVASGGLRQLTLGDRTINSPNNGKGYRNMPQNPKGIAWAVKQYNGFGGNWRSKQALQSMRLGSIRATRTETVDHEILTRLAETGLVRHIPSGDWSYWEITRKGAAAVIASLGPDLKSRMQAFLAAPYDDGAAKSLGKWIAENFRTQGPKTPPGQKDLKENVEALRWYLMHGGESYRASIEAVWPRIEPKIADLVRYFSDEGEVVPKELAVGNRVYINAAGLSQKALDQYAARLEAVFKSLGGWRAKALTGTLKVVLASPKEFRGTSGGKYKSGEDALYIRATPSVLKRGSGYASFEYILVHELGHRYERVASLSRDFDTWTTTRYSYKEGEAFAELFAIGHFGLTGNWDDGVVKKFEEAMK